MSSGLFKNIIYNLIVYTHTHTHTHIYIYIYIYIYMYIYIYIYICVCVCVCVEVNNVHDPGNIEKNWKNNVIQKAEVIMKETERYNFSVLMTHHQDL